MIVLLSIHATSAYHLCMQPTAGWCSAAISRRGSSAVCAAGVPTSTAVRRIKRTVAMQETMQEPDAAPTDVDGDAAVAVSESSAPRKHTEESKRKISAANKGRTPWNAGKRHSEETRRKIAEGTKRAILMKSEEERKNRERMRAEDPEAYAKLIAEEQAAERAKEQAAQAKANARRVARRDARRKAREAELGSGAAVRVRAPRRASTGGGRVNFTLSDESKAKISASLRERWKDPEYRARRTNNLTRSDETRAQISRTMKLRWRDEEYRKRMTTNNGSHTAERRAKIAEAIRKKWQDPEYRLKATLGIRKARGNESKRATNGLTQEAREKISEAMKRRWSDPAFREEQVGAMRQRSESSSQPRKKPAAKRPKSTPKKAGLEPKPAAADGAGLTPKAAGADAIANGKAAAVTAAAAAAVPEEATYPPPEEEVLPIPEAVPHEEEEVVVMAWGDTIIDFGEDGS